MPKSSHDIKTGKRSEFIISIIYHVRTTANVAAMCAFVTTYYYDRAVGLYISVAVVMRTLLDRKNFSSSANGQVAAHRVGLLSKGFGNTTTTKLLVGIRAHDMVHSLGYIQMSR